MSKPKVKFNRFNITLPVQVSDQLDQLCDEYAISRSSAISICITRLFKTLEMEKQLHNDMSDVTVALNSFVEASRPYRADHMYSDQIRELDSIKRLCQAISNNPLK